MARLVHLASHAARSLLSNSAGFALSSSSSSSSSWGDRENLLPLLASTARAGTAASVGVIVDSLA
ncbi:hypothetical protein PR001_g13011 [Phytophthora rubi]|uniref:Uncharacterized protein n=1 Tax=Phytophthora rubi TaxID=129364 RepID=A0A6A3M3Y9_9STRA|nr:hypothetical protein PR001_g13011 [Phytophthora rubi]